MASATARWCARRVPRFEQLDAELRPRVDAHDQPVVEHGEPRRLQHHPADLGAHVGALLVPRPRAHDVGRPDQLHAAAPEHVDLAAEQALDDQEAAVVDVRLKRARDVPLALRQALHAGDRLAARAVALGFVEELRELRVRLDDADRPGHGLRLPRCPRAYVGAPTRLAPAAGAPP
jgi:hypothetical protein